MSTSGFRSRVSGRFAAAVCGVETDRRNRRHPALFRSTRKKPRPSHRENSSLPPEMFLLMRQGGATAMRLTSSIESSRARRSPVSQRRSTLARPCGKRPFFFLVAAFADAYLACSRLLPWARRAAWRCACARKVQQDCQIKKAISKRPFPPAGQAHSAMKR